LQLKLGKKENFFKTLYLAFLRQKVESKQVETCLNSLKFLETCENNLKHTERLRNTFKQAETRLNKLKQDKTP
jgi:hypothetical protein